MVFTLINSLKMYSLLYKNGSKLVKRSGIHYINIQLFWRLYKIKDNRERSRNSFSVTPESKDQKSTTH